MTTVEETGAVMGGVSDEGALIAAHAAKPSLWATLIGSIGHQVVDQGVRLKLWAPVAFGGGCAIYFALKTEPPLWPLIVLALVSVVVWLGARRSHANAVVTFPLMILACLTLGLGMAKARSERVAGPIAPAMAEPTVVSGWVIDVDSPGQTGARVLIAPVRVRDLSPNEVPLRVRATVRGEPPAPGEAVRIFGLLNPPPAPAAPGGYDFGRGAYFQGMGGVLFGLGEARTADLNDPPWRLRLAMRINAMRYALAQRIVDRLGERTGGVAAAMVTGHETWIGQETLDAMRDSGLAHILSISGLHMAIVGGFVFFGVRLAVAAVPWLALRVSGKKVAAWAGLVAVGTYLIVSGSPPPAERAAITASIAFLAILLDRPALTMHALAVAAFAVLMMQPEAIVMPGFQMSFAATAALIALVEVWPRRVRELSVPFVIRAIQILGFWLMTAVTASLVAGLATGPFAMQHFNRVALYGLGANMATAPIADFVMMPMLALGAVLEPLGLGAPFLTVAGWGVDAMLAIGQWTADRPGAVRFVASAPSAALPIAFLGLLFICLWRGWARWFGLPFAAAVLIWPREGPPDVWIGDAGTQAAYGQGDQAVVLRPTVRQFASDIWTQRRGLTPQPRPAEGWSCRQFYCAPETPGPLALWWGRRVPSAEQLQTLCVSAQVVAVRASVTALPSACADTLVLDGEDFTRGGAVELWRTASGWRARWTADVRGDRPWSRYGQAEVD